MFFPAAVVNISLPETAIFSDKVHLFKKKKANSVPYNPEHVWYELILHVFTDVM